VSQGLGLVPATTDLGTALGSKMLGRHSDNERPFGSFVRNPTYRDDERGVVTRTQAGA
jgi:hypothetical protein